LPKRVPNKIPLIAIVDDDESVCRSLKRLIRSLGMAAETYASGLDFLEQIESSNSINPDCVILDVQMLGLNGIDVQTALRRLRKDIAIVFITAHDDPAARERALAGGAFALLRKPCNDALIMRTLNAALHHLPEDRPIGDNLLNDS